MVEKLIKVNKGELEMSELYPFQVDTVSLVFPKQLDKDKVLERLNELIRKHNTLVQIVFQEKEGD